MLNLSHAVEWCRLVIQPALASTQIRARWIQAVIRENEPPRVGPYVGFRIRHPGPLRDIRQHPRRRRYASGHPARLHCAIIV